MAQEAAMSEAGINPVLTDHEARELRLLIEQRSGILFDESRERFLTSRLVEQMERKGLTYGAELLRLVRHSNVEFDGMLERLLTQETSFLRYPALFSAFQQHVLPDLQDRKFREKDRALRILSAGCASGEEPYSIALSVFEAVGPRAELEASIMATDISHEALERAERGVYGRRALENLSSVQISNYFSKVGDSFEIKPQLRNLVKFAPMNLAQLMYLGRFDCIFCMNVMIYFGAELRSNLIQSFHRYLEPGGYLFLGHAESVANIPVKFNQRIVNGTRLLQKPLDQSAYRVRAAGGGR